MTELGRLAALVDRAAGDDGPRQPRPGHADGGAGDGHHRPRGAAARRPADETLLIEAEASPPRRCGSTSPCRRRHRPYKAAMKRILILAFSRTLLGGCVVGTVARPRSISSRCRSKSSRPGSMRRPPASPRPTSSAAANCARPTKSAPARSASAARSVVATASPARPRPPADQPAAMRYFLDTEYNGFGGAC